MFRFTIEVHSLLLSSRPKTFSSNDDDGKGGGSNPSSGPSEGPSSASGSCGPPAPPGPTSDSNVPDTGNS